MQDKNNQTGPAASDEANTVAEAVAGAPAPDDKLAAAEAKAQELEDAFLRAKAEVENVRRRAQEEVARAHKFAIESFAEALVPVRDSLEMALKIDTPSVESYQGRRRNDPEAIGQRFRKAYRLLEINPQPGDKLDPMKHQALSLVPADQEAEYRGHRVAEGLHDCRSPAASGPGDGGAGKSRLKILQYGA